MLFTSLEFIFMFFPIVFGVYFILPIKAKNYWLLASSLLFYAWGEPRFVFVMILSIIVNYILAIMIEKFQKQKKVYLIIAVILNLGLLFCFKYLNFFTSFIHDIFPQSQSLFPETSIALPIGISFFTFQAMSYVIDVYRGVRAQKNPAYLALYISMFPQLIAGPIVRYTNVMDQISERRVSFDGFSKGLFRFFCGFSKKVLLANTFAIIADSAFNSSSVSVSMAWLGAFCYALQIFFDFSGYSDMAIGMGRMLGFNFLENFNYPYISNSITEFWRRWHISLGSWFRDYVYFPLGGSRVNKSRLVFNLMIVWLLTGFWHGANWTFMLWGVLYGVVIIAEKLTGLPKKLERSPAVPKQAYRVLTLLLILIGWVLFRSDSILSAGHYTSTMFGLANQPAVDNDAIYYFNNYLVYIVIGVLCSLPIVPLIRGHLIKNGNKLHYNVFFTGYNIIQVVLFIVSVSFLVMNAHNPFIYFNF